MAYKFGDFTFSAGDEPERWDANYNNLSDGDHMPFEPFNYLDNLGLGVTSLVLQGYFTSRSDFEDLMAEYKNGGEITAQVQEWDGEERQFHGIAGGQAKESKVGQRKGAYDYILELACPDPFKYDTNLQYESYQNVADSDVSYSVASDQTGAADIYPIFVLNNDSGGTLSSLTFSAGDGGSSTSGNKLKVSLGDIDNSHRVVIAPIFYHNANDIYVARTAFDIGTSSITLASDDVRVEDSSDWTVAGSVQYDWPVIAAGTTTTIDCKTDNVTSLDVGIQWRKAY